MLHNEARNLLGVRESDGRVGGAHLPDKKETSGILSNQASTDQVELASLLNISENQLSYITNVDAGRGLIKCGNAIMPFVNSFPKNTHLHRLMSTKFSENQAS